MTKVIYGYDPLCGWCYGFIPTLTHLAKQHPDIAITVLPGGLVRGENIRSYATMRDYICQAAPKLEAITGRKPSEKFFDLLMQDNPPLMASAPPTHAVLQVAERSQDKTLQFAHAIQEAHFGEGLDLNIAQTYDKVTDELGLPRLDTNAILAATDRDPLIAQSYEMSACAGIRSFPTVVVLDEADIALGTISSIYDPVDFTAKFNALIAA